MIQNIKVISVFVLILFTSFLLSRGYTHDHSHPHSHDERDGWDTAGDICNFVVGSLTAGAGATVAIAGMGVNIGSLGSGTVVGVPAVVAGSAAAGAGLYQSTSSWNNLVNDIHNWFTPKEECGRCKADEDHWVGCSEHDGYYSCERGDCPGCRYEQEYGD